MSMTKQELYKMLELDSPADLGYFEQMADLLECEEEISFDLFYDVLSLVEADTAASIIENYFEEFSNAIPDDEDDFVVLVDSVKQNLLLGAENLDDGAVRREFAEALFTFREWIQKDGGAMIDELPCSVLAAVTEHRTEKLGGKMHRYSFLSVADYELDNISLSLGAYSKVDIVGDDDETDSKDFSN